MIIYYIDPNCYLSKYEKEIRDFFENNLKTPFRWAEPDEYDGLTCIKSIDTLEEIRSSFKFKNINSDSLLSILETNFELIYKEPDYTSLENVINMALSNDLASRKIGIDLLIKYSVGRDSNWVGKWPIKNRIPKGYLCGILAILFMFDNNDRISDLSFIFYLSIKPSVSDRRSSSLLRIIKGPKNYTGFTKNIDKKIFDWIKNG